MKKSLLLTLLSTLLLMGTWATAQNLQPEGLMSYGAHGNKLILGAADEVYLTNHAGTKPSTGLVDTNNIAPAIIKHAQVAVSSADILALSATPKTLIAAQGAGKTIILHRLEFNFTSGTSYSGGGAVVARYNTSNVAVISTLASTVVTGSSSIVIRNAIDAAATANVPIELSNATAAFTGGTGTALVDVWYSVI